MKDMPKRALASTFEPFLDEYINSLPLKIMIMGPSLDSTSIGGKLRLELVKRCNTEGISVIAEHKELVKVAKSKLGEGHELVTYELAVAKWSDIVIIIPDSAGSIAELGFFAAKEKLCPKMLIFFNNDYKDTQDKSYLWQGPGLAAKNAAAYYVDFFDYNNIDDIWRIVQIKIQKERASKLRTSLSE